jgi:hypothetical protein
MSRSLPPRNEEVQTLLACLVIQSNDYQLQVAGGAAFLIQDELLDAY